MLAAAVLSAAPAAQARYASIVIDFETGQVLHETNADTRNYPASLVKMMTLYMAFEALERGELKLDQRLKVSRRAAGMAPSRLGLNAGQTITVRDAILALITKSANDVAVVFAEALADTETNFAKKMTTKARALGMTRTTFRNASGLPNRYQLSTARDMATLARALIREFPDYYPLFATESFEYKGRRHRNHNRLLDSYAGTDGIKTGYIRASGFNLATSVVRGGRRLVAVVFGGRTSRSRDKHMAKLLDRSFTQLAMAGIGKVPTPPPPKPTVTVAAVTPQEHAVVALAAEETEPEAVSAEMGSTEETGPEPGWGVQVGAYYQRDAAERAATTAAARAPEVLDGAQSQVTPLDGRRGTIYRARLVGLDETSARVACKRLRVAKVDCMVFQTDRTVALQ